MIEENPQSGSTKTSDDNKRYKFIKKCSVHLFDEMITKTLTDIKKTKNDNSKRSKGDENLW